jgi:hypothetical protein
MSWNLERGLVPLLADYTIRLNVAPGADGKLRVTKVIERIKTLRLLTQKTGLQTVEEQFKILLSLDNADALAVADALRVGGGK